MVIKWQQVKSGGKKFFFLLKIPKYTKEKKKFHNRCLYSSIDSSLHLDLLVGSTSNMREEKQIAVKLSTPSNLIHKLDK